MLDTKRSVIGIIASSNLNRIVPGETAALVDADQFQMTTLRVPLSDVNSATGATKPQLGMPSCGQRGRPCLTITVPTELPWSEPGNTTTQTSLTGIEFFEHVDLHMSAFSHCPYPTTKDVRGMSLSLDIARSDGTSMPIHQAITPHMQLRAENITWSLPQFAAVRNLRATTSRSLRSRIALSEPTAPMVLCNYWDQSLGRYSSLGCIVEAEYNQDSVLCQCREVNRDMSVFADPVPDSVPKDLIIGINDFVQYHWKYHDNGRAVVWCFFVIFGIFVATYAYGRWAEENYGAYLTPRIPWRFRRRHKKMKALMKDATARLTPGVLDDVSPILAFFEEWADATWYRCTRTHMWIALVFAPPGELSRPRRALMVIVYLWLALGCSVVLFARREYYRPISRELSLTAETTIMCASLGEIACLIALVLMPVMHALRKLTTQITPPGYDRQPVNPFMTKDGLFSKVTDLQLEVAARIRRPLLIKAIKRPTTRLAVGLTDQQAQWAQLGLKRGGRVILHRRERAKMLDTRRFRHVDGFSTLANTLGGTASSQPVPPDYDFQCLYQTINVKSRRGRRLLFMTPVTPPEGRQPNRIFLSKGNKYYGRRYLGTDEDELRFLGATADDSKRIGLLHTGVGARNIMVRVQPCLTVGEKPPIPPQSGTRLDSTRSRPQALQLLPPPKSTTSAMFSSAFAPGLGVPGQKSLTLSTPPTPSTTTATTVTTNGDEVVMIEAAEHVAQQQRRQQSEEECSVEDITTGVSRPSSARWSRPNSAGRSGPNSDGLLNSGDFKRMLPTIDGAETGKVDAGHGPTGRLPHDGQISMKSDAIDQDDVDSTVCASTMPGASTIATPPDVAPEEVQHPVSMSAFLQRGSNPSIKRDAGAMNPDDMLSMLPISLDRVKARPLVSVKHDIHFRVRDQRQAHNDITASEISRRRRSIMSLPSLPARIEHGAVVAHTCMRATPVLEPTGLGEGTGINTGEHEASIGSPGLSSKQLALSGMVNKPPQFAGMEGTTTVAPTAAQTARAAMELRRYNAKTMKVKRIIRPSVGEHAKVKVGQKSIFPTAVPNTLVAARASTKRFDEKTGAPSAVRRFQAAGRLDLGLGSLVDFRREKVKMFMLPVRMVVPLYVALIVLAGLISFTIFQYGVQLTPRLETCVVVAWVVTILFDSLVLQPVMSGALEIFRAYKHARYEATKYQAGAEFESTLRKNLPQTMLGPARRKSIGGDGIGGAEIGLRTTKETSLDLDQA